MSKKNKILVVAVFLAVLFIFLFPWLPGDIDKPIPEIAPIMRLPAHPKKPFKPKPDILLNKAKWSGFGFDLILKNECNDCKDVCWYHRGDAGGLTCIGIASSRNPAFYQEVLNSAFKNCRNKGVLVLPGEKESFGAKKDFCWHLRTYYWEHYVNPYSKCPFEAMIHLSDTAILQGPREANKIFQRSLGLKPDGVFGPKSLTACKNFNKKAFIKERTQAIMRYKDFDRFGQGWLNRIENMSKLNL